MKRSETVEYYFDRGTLVVERAPCELPDYFLWDERVKRWRSPAYRMRCFRAWLEQRGLRSIYESPRPARFVPRRSSVSVSLRLYQEQALKAWGAAARRGLVSLPTGSGKTRIALSAILRIGRPSLVVAPTRQLVHQWVAALREHYPGPIGIYGDGERDLHPITVATFESAHIHLDLLGDHFDLVVADEVHHLASARLSEIAQMTTAPFRLGLSATLPEDGDGRDRLEELFGPLCFTLPLERLSGRYLAAFSLDVVALRLDPDELSEYESQRQTFLGHFKPFMEAHPGASWADFARAASASPGGREALRALRASKRLLSLPRAKRVALDQLLDKHAGDPTLVFTSNNESAYAVSSQFLVPAITCDIDREERQRILERFESGDYRAIVSAKVLNEGIDVPAASVAIIVGGSSNTVQHAQRIGRVLRPAPGKQAAVYELVIAGTTDWTAGLRRRTPDVVRSALTL